MNLNNNSLRKNTILQLNNCRKILVTGNAGAGKTTVARLLAAYFNLDFYSLDSIVWQKGWQQVDRDTRKRKINAILRQEQWVIDGVSFDACDAADAILFLDIERSRCYYQALKRNYRCLFKSRPELPANCPEYKILPKLCRIIWNFPLQVRPTLLEKLSSKDNCYRLDFAEVNNLLKELNTNMHIKQK